MCCLNCPTCMHGNFCPFQLVREGTYGGPSLAVDSRCLVCHCGNNQDNAPMWQMPTVPKRCPCRLRGKQGLPAEGPTQRLRMAGSKLCKKRQRGRLRCRHAAAVCCIPSSGPLIWLSSAPRPCQTLPSASHAHRRAMDRSYTPLFTPPRSQVWQPSESVQV